MLVCHGVGNPRDRVSGKVPSLVNCCSPVHLSYESKSRLGPWAFRIDTGHRTRAFVLADGFFKLVDRLTWLTPIDMVDAIQVFTISNRYGHLYRSCNDGPFSSRSFQFQRL